MHHYRKHIKDYRGDTTGLTLLDHGVYNQLLEECYITEQPLPSDAAQIARLLGARTSEEMDSLRYILGRFFYLNRDGNYWHNRVEKELSAIYERSEKARKSQEIRWERQREQEALRVLHEQQANHEGAHLGDHDLYEKHTNVSKIDTNVSKIDTNHYTKCILPSNPLPSNPLPTNREVQKRSGPDPKKFKKPTLEEVQEYFEDRTQKPCNIEHEKFFDFYESKGWKVGKNPMKDWKAAVRNWIRKHKEDYRSQHGKTTDTGRLKTTQQTIDNMQSFLQEDNS
ncbi:YdaU family protein [uncultured Paraglaciecola sp.]|uniref:YdaU family protein n=1 Tax=uncultured Paraglaciecola sp. TaxID=1765024 RepID=UPI002626D8F2|nr:YdaU family protein [uncultured Paraglaciecola sp.]